MTDLSAKFAGLQTQLTNQHSELMNALNLIRQDVNAIKTSAAATATHTGNMEAFTLQIAQSNVDIYNRLQTLNELYYYLSRDADQGLDLISRINYLQARANELNGYVDGLEGLIDAIKTQVASLVTDSAAIKFSVAPSPAYAMATALRTVLNNTNAARLALLGDRADSIWEPMAKTLDDLQGAFPTVMAASQSIDGKMTDVLTAIDGLASCVCTPTPDVCDTGTALPVSYLSAEGPRQIKRMNAETTDIIDTGYPILCDSFFDPVNSGGISGDTLLWDSVAPAIFPVGVAEWCIRNETSGTTVEIATLDVSEEPHVFLRASVAPGSQQHIYNNGPLTWAAVWVSTLPLGQEDKISVIAFGAG